MTALFLFIIAALSVFADPLRSPHISQPDRLVVFGDIHGDLSALRQILRTKNLIDENEDWIGRDAVVISLGDLIGRGTESKEVMDLMMKLEAQAPGTGGRVVALLGNHELMVTQSQFDYFSRKDAHAFTDFVRHSDEKKTPILKRVFSGKSKYARWLASRPALVSVDLDQPTLFAHGGIDEWITEYSLETVNEYIRAWLLYHQGNGPQPPEWSKRFINGRGPLWTRRLAEEKIPPEEFRSWLKEAGYRRLVVGHTITDTYQPELRTETYGDRLIMMDTGISAAIGGNIHTLTWTTARGFTTRRIPRPRGSAACMELTLTQYL